MAEIGFGLLRKNKEKEDSIPGGLVAETSLRKVSTVPSRRRHGDPADWQEGGSRCQAAPLSASSWRDPGKGECCRNALGNMHQARLSTWPRARVMMSLIASRRPEAWCVCVCVCVLVAGGTGQVGIKGRVQGKKLPRTTEGISALDTQP